MTVYFEKTGRENTAKTTELALLHAKEQGIKHIVVASNTGNTAKHLLAEDVKIVCVTHHVGFKEPGYQEMTQEAKEELQAKGVEFLTTTHLMGGIERAITQNQGGLYVGGIVADTLRMFSQGTKVAVEISVMALDSGLIPYGEPVIAVAGTGGGADTAVVLLPSHAKTFFETEIHEIICKPRCPKREAMA